MRHDPLLDEVTDLIETLDFQYENLSHDDLQKGLRQLAHIVKQVIERTDK